MNLSDSQCLLLVKHLSLIEDFRINRNKKHLLIDIIFITVIAVLCRYEDWESIEMYAKVNEAWFRKYLRLMNGIPSHDTIRRVFMLLKPKSIENSFQSWIGEFVNKSEVDHIAIDGKTLRSSYDLKSGKKAIHMVSAFATNCGLILGQLKTAEKSNEITAIPELLDIVDVSNATVTIDAMGCQAVIADKIIQNKGKYILAVKNNQHNLYSNIEDKVSEIFFNKHTRQNKNLISTVTQKHGREEYRLYGIIKNIKKTIDNDNKWSGLSSIGYSYHRTILNGKIRENILYHILSKGVTLQQYAEISRKHWHIENKLHWVMDVSFSEDSCRKRMGHAANNISVIRHMVINMVRKDTSNNYNLTKRRRLAAMNPDYIDQVLLL